MTSTLARQRGFSVFELLLVTAIIIVLGSLAVPSIIDTLQIMRLRNSANGFARVVQTARVQSVRDNQTYSVRLDPPLATASPNRWIFVDLDGDGEMGDDEIAGAFNLPLDVTPAAAGAPVLTSMGVANFNPGAADLPNFNPRGLPCGGTPCGNRAFVFYLTQQRRDGTTAWAAVTVTNSGRVRSWVWTGTSWR